MGLFSFLFSKHKLLRTTYEAETFRAVFREDEELFLRVEKGEELKRYRELEEYVNSAQFKERRKEIEQLSYKDSEYYKAERQYKALLKVRKLQSYLLIADSEELKGYERVKALPEYQEYQKLKVMAMSAGNYVVLKNTVRLKIRICHKSLRIWKLISVRKNSSETELIS